MIKFISETVYNFIVGADKETLLRMQKEITRELKSGTLKGIQYTKELELINSRLIPTK